MRLQPRQKDGPPIKIVPARQEMVPSLEPRDSFYGGRTGAATLCAKAGEDIKYCDVTSLYPWVN